MSKRSIENAKAMTVRFHIHRADPLWRAKARGHAIHSQGRTLEELYSNIRGAASLHFQEFVAKGKTLRIVIVAETEVGPKEKRI